MRARSCNFALRNRLKRDRSPDVRDMLTSFLVLKTTSPVVGARWGEDRYPVSAFLKPVAVQLCTMRDELNSMSFWGVWR